MINRLVWGGGVAVTLVTIGVLLLAIPTADVAWEYLLYAALGGVPLIYGLFTNFVVRRVQVELLHQYQGELQVRITRLEELATVDELSGLANRRHFYEVANAAVARARESKEPLAILLMDLDGLKKVNDEYGHPVGDVVIANLSRALAKLVRAVDVAARLGGDEFGVIMPDTDKRGAFALAERLCDDLEKNPMCDQDGVCVMATVSIGVAGYPWGGETIEEMLHWADSDMYANKVSRRIPEGAAAIDNVGDLDSLPDDTSGVM